MAKHGVLLSYRSFSVLIITLSLLCRATCDDKKVYIVYLGSLLSVELYSLSSHHLSILQKVVEDSSPENVLVRSYKRSFNGFSARLTDQEREKLSNMKEVVSVFPSRTLQLQTTRSWDFMGFSERIGRNSTVESDIIVGVIDSGIWPESDSFKDEGFGPPPKKWKDACEASLLELGITHQRSLQGMTRVMEPTLASTAAGNATRDVSFYGLAQGTARGGVPSARIAAYKVCTAGTLCSAHDTLAAFDDAIADGVDIITASVAFSMIQEFDVDPLAIGTFHAMEKGILTSHAAGNNRPSGATVSSVAPWVLTVAASSMDQRIIDKVVLGNETTVIGSSVNSFTLNATSFPLIHGKDASRNCTGTEARDCEQGYLDSDLVKGKVLLCDRYRLLEAFQSGALGSILPKFRAVDDASYVLPLAGMTINNENYNVVMSYMNSTRDPRVNILKSEVIKNPAAPAVASFSARGPNLILPDIIKPDIRPSPVTEPSPAGDGLSAPGIEIFAAFSSASISTTPGDMRRVNYNIQSGTSMSCPHAAGVAAYVKTFHPDWSPAAIKSSIMTTGHINPLKAIDPGLVYDASKEDYIKFLCISYDESRVRLVSGGNSTCPTGPDKGSLKDHNYPSMGAKVTAMQPLQLHLIEELKKLALQTPLM
ncbi:hypothetical protein ACLB2K_021791 [Fragaria x ananassa]